MKKLWEFLDEKLGGAQVKALSHVVKFFLFMLLCTLIARGAAGATMARVKLCSPVQQTMVETLDAAGHVTCLDICSLTFTVSRAEGERLLAWQAETDARYLRVLQGGTFAQVSDFQIHPDRDPETMTVTAVLPAGGWSDGGAMVAAELSNITYSTCVPISALHQDSRGWFVLILQQERTILGIRELAVRVDVTLEDQDGSYAAVSAPGLHPDVQVIASGNKPIREGDRVREAS